MLNFGFGGKFMFNRSIFLIGILFSSINLQAGITKNKVDNGNWLASVSIGLNIEEKPTMALSDTLEELFLSRQGGYYKKAFNINDAKLDPYEDIPIKFSEIEDKFRLLNSELDRFKNRKPGKERTVVFGLTGHGITNKEGKYRFRISRDETITGKQLMNLIESIHAEKVILIMQSCQSGTVPNALFANFVEEVRGSLVLSRTLGRKGISVITPVNKYINSPIYSFEEVMKSSFKSLSDRDKNHIVNFEEFINSITENAIKHKDYFPFKKIVTPDFIKELKSKNEKIAHATEDIIHRQILMGFNGAGVSPQIYHRNIKSTSPVFVTQEGANRIRKGKELIPAMNRGEPEISLRVERLSNQVVKVLRDAIRIQVESKDFEEVQEKLLALGKDQPRWLQRQLAARFEFVFDFKNPFKDYFANNLSKEDFEARSKICKASFAK